MIAEERQSEIGLKLTNLGAGAIQVFEAIAIIVIAVVSMSKQFDSLQNAAPSLFIHAIIEVSRYAIIFIIFVGGFMAADLLKWLLYSGLIYVNKKEWGKAAVYLVGLLVVGTGFYLTEKTASKNIGHTYFAIPEDKTKYTDDANYNLRNTEKEKIQSAWEGRKKELKEKKSQCPDCGIIEAKYNSEILSWRRRVVSTDADRVYVQKNVSAIESKKLTEIKTAKAKREVEIDKEYREDELDYKSKMSAADNTLKTITAKIDTGRVLNQSEVDERKKQIDFWASGFSWITLIAQVLLRVGRFYFLLSKQRMDEVWDENNIVLDLFQNIPFMGMFFEDTYWVEKLGNHAKVKHANRVKYNRTQTWNTELKLKREAKYWSFIKEKSVPNNIKNRAWFIFAGANTKIDEDIFRDFQDAYQNGYSIINNQQNVYENTPQEVENKIEENNQISQENSENNVENALNLTDELSDKEEILQIVADCEMLLGRADENDTKDIVEIISDCKLLLKRLN